jgi:hypothetical protein
MGLRIVKVSRQYLEQIVRGEMPGVTSDAPNDMEVAGVVQSDAAKRCDCFEIVCRSIDWESTGEATLIPEVTINYETEKRDE